MKTPFTLRPLAFTLIVLVLQITSGYCQRMPQDSWYLKKTVETGMFIGGAACDNDGNIYLSDAKLGLIKKFSPTYQLLQTWGGLGTGDGQFGTVGFQPAVRWRNWSHVGAGGMCFTAAQELVVCDPANHRVQVFSKTGTFLRKFGTQGTGDGQFNSPVAAAVSADGKIYVADRDNHRIQAFSPSGVFLSKFGTQGSFDGELSKPSGISFMPNGDIAVADSGNKRIQRFSSSGAYVRKINQSASSLAASSDGVLFASDHWGSQAMGGDGRWSKALNQPKSEIVAWGGVSAPEGLGNVVEIDAHENYSLALLADGSLSGWRGEPINNVIAIEAGKNHMLALLGDGTVRAQGWSGVYRPDVPLDLNGVVAIAAGTRHSMALLNDGTVRSWGYEEYNLPSGLNGVVDIAAGEYFSLALCADGTIKSGGFFRNGYDAVQVKAIEAGKFHALALLADGTVRSWHANDGSINFSNFGQSTVPSDLTGVVAIAAGDYHSLALLNDGTVRAWGANTNGQTTVPSGLRNVAAIAAGGNNSLALKSDGGYFAGLCVLPNGDFFEVRESGRLSFYSRTFRTILPDEPNSIPRPVVLASSQRPGTSLVDVDFRVDDEDDATVHVAALAFRNGGTGVGDVIPMRTLVEGTGTKLGAAVATGQVHRITWDARADMPGDFEQLQYEILAKDQRSLLNLDYLTLPAEGSQPALKISKTPLKDEDFLSVWLWLVAIADSEITLSNGTIKLLGSQYTNGLNATYYYSWNPQWNEVLGATQREDGGPLSRLDLVPEFYGRSFDSQVGGINWTGLFMPQKTGNYTIYINDDDYWVGDGASIVIGDELKFYGYSGSFTLDAQVNLPIPISISYFDDTDWAQSFNLKIQPPDEPRRGVQVGDFVVEKPLVAGTETSQIGRSFLLSKMGLREATAAEILRAKEAATPGIINQWSPPLQIGPGDRPLKVNAYGFETGDAGVWVVPVAP